MYGQAKVKQTRFRFPKILDQMPKIWKGCLFSWRYNKDTKQSQKGD